ncbi:MAG TPA: hypothetical protein VHA06_20180, partial [Candidatus Angelobacter sp.]|nr:hypothetical protein [Candidatus Angelobacter sp.]
MATAIVPPKTAPEAATHPRIFRWILLGFAVCAGILVILLAVKWPFTRNGMIQRLEKASSAKVEMGRFHGIFFPYFGCVAEDVVFRQAASGTAQPAEPIITIRKMTIESTLFGLLSKPGKVKKIIAEGLRVQVPAGGANLHPASGSKGDQIIIEQLIAENALLEVAPGVDGHKPLV